MDENEYAEVYTDAAGDKRWRMRDVDNDEILADSGQGYSDDRDLIKALGRVSNRHPRIVESKSVSVAGYLRVVRVDG